MGEVWVAAAGVAISAASAAYSISSAEAAKKKAAQAAKAAADGVGTYGSYRGEAVKSAGAQQQIDRSHAVDALSLYPQLADAQRDEQRKSAELLLELYPQFTKAERLATSQQRSGDLGDLHKYGEGFKDVYGQLSSGYDALDGVVSRAGESSPLLDHLNADALQVGPSDIRNKLETSANAGLDLGRDLSPEQLREVQQSTRSAYGDRGMAYGNQAIVGEVLARDGAGTARERERQQFAAGVDDLAMREDAANRGYGIGVQQLNEADTTNRTNQIIGASNAQLSPIVNAYGRTATNFGAPATGMGFAASPLIASQVLTGGPNLYQNSQVGAGILGFGQDMYNTQANAGFAASNNQANSYAALAGGATNLAGSLSKQYIANQGTTQTSTSNLAGGTRAYATYTT